MDLYVYLAAPLIIVPAKDSESPETRCVFADLGTLQMSSVLQDPGKGNLANKSAEELERLAYDIFDIQLLGMQVLLGKRSDRKNYSFLDIPSSPKHILNKMNVKLTAQKCLQDYHTELASIKIDGELPQVKVRACACVGGGLCLACCACVQVTQ